MSETSDHDPVAFGNNNDFQHVRPIDGHVALQFQGKAVRLTPDLAKALGAKLIACAEAAYPSPAVQ